MEVTKHALLANEFIPCPPSWASVLNAMRFIYVYISQVFTVKTTVIPLKISWNSCLIGLDQLFTGRAGRSSRRKGFNNIFSILSKCAPRGLVVIRMHFPSLAAKASETNYNHKIFMIFIGFTLEAR